MIVLFLPRIKIFIHICILLVLDTVLKLNTTYPTANGELNLLYKLVKLKDILHLEFTNELYFFEELPFTVPGKLRSNIWPLKIETIK